jgi:hypothetical protein
MNEKMRSDLDNSRDIESKKHEKIGREIVFDNLMNLIYYSLL